MNLFWFFMYACKSFEIDTDNAKNKELAQKRLDELLQSYDIQMELEDVPLRATPHFTSKFTMIIIDPLCKHNCIHNAGHVEDDSQRARFEDANPAYCFFNFNSIWYRVNYAHLENDEQRKYSL